MSLQAQLPAGGEVRLHSSAEVELWNRSREKYVEDYHLTRLNDLVLLGVILQQQIILYRAQRRINGEEAILDPSGAPTGQYQQVSLEDEETLAAMSLITKAAAEVMKIERALGIDKVARESGGAHNVADYITTLKRAAHARGVMISKRLLKYEEVVNEAKWRLRILFNEDTEDRAYHDLTPENVCRWIYDQLLAIEEGEKKWSREHGKVFVGKL